MEVVVLLEGQPNSFTIGLAAISRLALPIRLRTVLWMAFAMLRASLHAEILAVTLRSCLKNHRGLSLHSIKRVIAK